MKKQYLRWAPYILGIAGSAFLWSVDLRIWLGITLLFIAHTFIIFMPVRNDDEE